MADTSEVQYAGWAIVGHGGCTSSWRIAHSESCSLRARSPWAGLTTVCWVQDVLHKAGLLRMFPLLSDTVCGLQDTHCGTTAGEYFEKMTILNQVVSLSRQLGLEAAKGKSQKYLAHQTALLYVRSALNGATAP